MSSIKKKESDNDELTKFMQMKKNKSSKREMSERERESQNKKKAKDELSLNSNTKKTRQRIANFTSLKQELKKRKLTNKSTINRAVKILKKTVEYENVTKNEKQTMI